MAGALGTAGRRHSVAEIRALLAGRDVARTGAPGPLATPAPDRTVEAPVPSVATARRAGFAVRALDVVGASATGPVVLEGMPARVRIGDPMPAGTDAVLDPALVTVRRGLALAEGAAAPGDGIRRAGADLSAGAILRGCRGNGLAGAVALFAGLDTSATALPAGLAPSALAPPPGATMHAAALLLGGLSVEGVDVVVTCDPPAEAAGHDGWTVFASALALAPGDDTIVITSGGRVRIVLPALADAILAVRLAILDPLSGAERETVTAPLLQKVSSSVGMTDVVLLDRTPEGLRVLASGDWSLHSLLQARYHLVVEPGSEGFPAGVSVTATAIDG